MENYKRILTVQDISCVGQCSLTVALPVLSACGIETAVLPSAVLSTHTAGFTGWTFRDLTDDMPGIESHWIKEGIKFDAFYTGYLGSAKQIGYVKSIMSSTAKPGAVKIVDPAMADNGKLYPAFDMAYVDEMKKLCAYADIILPNITEACFLLGEEYREKYTMEWVESLLVRLSQLGPKTVVLTGVSFDKETTGVSVFERTSEGGAPDAHASDVHILEGKGRHQYYRHKKIEPGCHGTGDVYASAFTGALLKGHSNFEAARIAADYVVACIEKTAGDPNHRYGVKFELALPELIEMVWKTDKA